LDLAGYEIDEIAEGLSDAEQQFPTLDGIPVADMIKAVIDPAVEELRKAVEARSSAQFTVAFDNLTAACNACHAGANKPFIRIQRPSSLPLSNQDFAPEKITKLGSGLRKLASERSAACPKAGSDPSARSFFAVRSRQARRRTGARSSRWFGFVAKRAHLFAASVGETNVNIPGIIVREMAAASVSGRRPFPFDTAALWRFRIITLQGIQVLI